MALAAAQVVDWLAARLVLVPATGGHVDTARGWPVAESELPRWRVLASDEQIERIGFDGLQRHTLSVDATLYVRAAVDLDDQMHTIAAAGLLQVFAASQAKIDIRSTAISRRMHAEGEAELGAIALRFEALFHTYQSDPETIV